MECDILYSCDAVAFTCDSWLTLSAIRLIFITTFKAAIRAVVTDVDISNLP